MSLSLVAKHALQALDDHKINYTATGNADQTTVTFTHDELDQLAEALRGELDHQCEYGEIDVEESYQEGKAAGRAEAIKEIKALVDGAAA